MIKMLLAALVLFPAHALASDCSLYAAKDFPHVTLNEDDKSFTVRWERYSETYAKAVVKNFGVLVEAAAKLNATETHYVTRQTIEGKQAIILDSLIFMPACD